MESCFSFAQWQELELQTLIFRYMLAGTPVPPQLLQPIKKSFFHSPPPFLQLYHPPCKFLTPFSFYFQISLLLISNGHFNGSQEQNLNSP
ncbi:hypothetical protein VIGAN_08280900 [Vigna angularis var. angularis]|uniref:Growth-regulating factor n=1 Tax=Vigna angularis var. angularis TaxID=157739 RepID=A0A0S3ST06_PHAAN|nr:hypothetical protein VIGAN_08280900 [Vigna angularis var. angularis]